MNDPKTVQEWWRGATVYQIYPRSFHTPDGDAKTPKATGTLNGITEKLPYIASLGVDAIWISPFFKSPMKDFGYDVSDYRDIDPMFGTLSDFDTLLARAHELNLKIIIDLVLSHTSDQHPWFQNEATKDMYVWADGKSSQEKDVHNETYTTGSQPPNNWMSVFGGSAWKKDKRYDQYYLHNFLESQPDLNFHNPKVIDEVLDIVRFWLERGVDGFRLDVVNFYFHNKDLTDNPPRDPTLGAATQFEGPDAYSEQAHIHDKSQPENIVFIEKLRALMDEYPDRYTIGEIGDDHPYERAAEYTAHNRRLNTTYNTHLMGGKKRALTANLIRAPFEKTSALEDKYPGAYPSWAFSNHDVVRAVSRWLPDGNGFDHDPAFAKMLIALLSCLYGCVYLYQGEELGLPEAKLEKDQLQDPWGIRLWPEWQGRDGCRTPIPWTKDTPDDQWLPIPAEHRALNAADQDRDPNSTLNFTRKILKQRKTKPTLLYGDITFIDTDDPHLLIFDRTYNGATTRCSFNLSNKEIKNNALEENLHPFGVRITDRN